MTANTSLPGAPVRPTAGFMLAQPAHAGGTVPVPERQRRVVVKPAAPVAAAEADALRDFLAVRGRDIAGLLSRTDEEGQLRLAGAYRAILVGQPGAHVAWGRLIASLGL